MNNEKQSSFSEIREAVDSKPTSSCLGDNLERYLCPLTKDFRKPNFLQALWNLTTLQFGHNRSFSILQISSEPY
jgi:hypothetical protein